MSLNRRYICTLYFDAICQNLFFIQHRYTIYQQEACRPDSSAIDNRLSGHRTFSKCHARCEKNNCLM